MFITHKTRARTINLPELAHAESLLEVNLPRDRRRTHVVPVRVVRTQFLPVCRLDDVRPRRQLQLIRLLQVRRILNTATPGKQKAESQKHIIITSHIVSQIHHPSLSFDASPLFVIARTRMRMHTLCVRACASFDWMIKIHDHVSIVRTQHCSSECYTVCFTHTMPLLYVHTHIYIYIFM